MYSHNANKYTLKANVVNADCRDHPSLDRIPLCVYSCIVKQLQNSTIETEAVCGDLLLDVVPLVMTAIRARSADIKPAELSIAQFRALAFIDRYAGLSLSAVAEMLGLSLSSVSKLIEGLVQSGYVRHEVCPEDRRRARLESTAKGRTTMRRARAHMREVLATRLLELEPAALVTVTDALLQLQQLFAPPSASQS